LALDIKKNPGKFPGCQVYENGVLLKCQASDSEGFLWAVSHKLETGQIVAFKSEQAAHRCVQDYFLDSQKFSKEMNRDVMQKSLSRKKSPNQNTPFRHRHFIAISHVWPRHTALWEYPKHALD